MEYFNNVLNNLFEEDENNNDINDINDKISEFINFTLIKLYDTGVRQYDTDKLLDNINENFNINIDINTLLKILDNIDIVKGVSENTIELLNDYEMDMSNDEKIDAKTQDEQDEELINDNAKKAAKNNMKESFTIGEKIKINSIKDKLKKYHNNTDMFLIENVIDLCPEDDWCVDNIDDNCICVKNINGYTLDLDTQTLFDIVKKPELERQAYLNDKERIKNCNIKKIRRLLNNIKNDIDMANILKNHPTAIQYIDNPSNNIQNYVLTIEPDCIKYIKNPTKEAIIRVLNSKPELLQEVDFTKLNEN